MVRELADGFIEVFVPHIIYGASCASHDKSAKPKEAEVCERRGERHLKRVGSHGDRPSCKEN